MSFIDDATRKSWVYPMHQKDDVFKTLKFWLAYVENQTGRSLKSLRSDNGGEYVSKEFDDFLALKGIKRELPPPHNPDQNGVAERLNQTIKDRVRSMLSHAVVTCCIISWVLG
ncbi:DDE-type integrase/transposase/recombinase [Escherichia coli]|uniref:DDE-type integrase/transposase/recombinase n=1 Tax=Escherichia coli TaxID=562 RepID=UPI00336A1B2A